MELIIFTNAGKTYIFYGVENFKPTTDGFSFDYNGKSTGMKRHAQFSYTSVSGYAIVES